MVSLHLSSYSHKVHDLILRSLVAASSVLSGVQTPPICATPLERRSLRPVSKRRPAASKRTRLSMWRIRRRMRREIVHNASCLCRSGGRKASSVRGMAEEHEADGRTRLYISNTVYAKSLLLGTNSSLWCCGKLRHQPALSVRIRTSA